MIMFSLAISSISQLVRVSRSPCTRLHAYQARIQVGFGGCPWRERLVMFEAYLLGCARWNGAITAAGRTEFPNHVFIGIVGSSDVETIWNRSIPRHCYYNLCNEVPFSIYFKLCLQVTSTIHRTITCNSYFIGANTLSKWQTESLNTIIRIFQQQLGPEKLGFLPDAYLRREPFYT